MFRPGVTDRLAARPIVTVAAVLGGVAVAVLSLFLARPRAGFADPALESVVRATRAVVIVVVVLMALLLVARAMYVHLADATRAPPVRFEARLRTVETGLGVVHLASLALVVTVEALQSGDVVTIPVFGTPVALLSGVGLLLAVAVHLGLVVAAPDVSGESAPEASREAAPEVSHE